MYFWRKRALRNFCLFCLVVISYASWHLWNIVQQPSVVNRSATLWNSTKRNDTNTALKHLPEIRCLKTLSEKVLRKTITIRKDLTELHEIVQKQIWNLQNPSNCSSARRLICNLNANGGHACQIHHMGICLFLAIGTNRTVRFRIETPQYSKLLHDATYRPISETCGDVTEEEYRNAVPIKGDGKSETTSNEILVKLQVNGAFGPFTPFAPYTIPFELKEILLDNHDRPHIWWIGQVLEFVTRLKPEVQDRIEKLKKDLNFKNPIVGLHIRRGDKKIENPYQDIKDYMCMALHWYSSHPYEDQPKKAFLATDDPNVVQEITKKYEIFKFINIKKNTEAAVDTSNRVKESGFYGIVEDVQLLAATDHLVCTLSSNVCRLAYTLQLARKKQGIITLDSLDDEYMYYGAHPRYQEVIEGHTPQGEDEIELQIGDLMYIEPTRRKCLLGRCFGTNDRTRKTGFYPENKIREYAKAVSYAGFSLSQSEVERLKRGFP